MTGRAAAPAAATARCRVLGVVGEPMNAVSYIRFVQPFEHLRDLGFELATLGTSLPLVRTARGYGIPEEMLDGVGMVLFPQMVASPVLADGTRVDVVGSICDRASSLGIRTVYSVDDALEHLDPVNPNYERIRGSFGNLDTILEHADAIIVTTPPLAETLGKLGKSVHLLPNAVDPARWRPRPRLSGELRVGWTGSGTHVRDLLAVIPALRDLQKKLPFRLVLQGLTPRTLEDERAEVRRLLPGLDPARRETAEGFLEMTGLLREVDHAHVPFAPVESFFEILPSLDLDIGLCPLLDTAFNRHKSANKFYEYAVTGSMTVASAVTPYLEEVSVTTPNDPRAWSETLERWLRSEEERGIELERQREFVLTERNIETLRHRWASVLREIAAGA